MYSDIKCVRCNPNGSSVAKLGTNAVGRNPIINAQPHASTYIYCYSHTYPACI